MCEENGAGCQAGRNVTEVIFRRCNCGDFVLAATTAASPCHAFHSSQKLVKESQLIYLIEGGDVQIIQIHSELPSFIFYLLVAPRTRVV